MKWAAKGAAYGKEEMACGKQQEGGGIKQRKDRWRRKRRGKTKSDTWNHQGREHVDRGYGGWDAIDNMTVDQCARMPTGMQTVEFIPNSLQNERTGHGAQCTG